MNSLIEFIKGLNEKLGIPIPEDWPNISEADVARHFLQGINEFLFQTYQGIGTTQFGKLREHAEDIPYFSEFHKFWEKHYREILNVQIDYNRASIAAQCFSNAVRRYGKRILGVTLDTDGLPPDAIAQVRFLTANQDFREPPQEQFKKYSVDSRRFEAEEVVRNPAGFLAFIGMARLSQTDKRIDYALNAAKFLIDRGIDAAEIAPLYENDAVKIRESLINTPNMGYGSKKANMFIRDMVELKVWKGLKNYQDINVASDINTVKLALRAQILRTDVPLVSSFLDIFCHQYSHIDEMSANAWRAVWEKWHEIDSDTVPSSPCELDFLLYRIGREYCKDNLVEYSCDKGHVFYHFGALLRQCRICKQDGIRTNATPQKKLMPCQVSSDNLPREKGKLLLDDKNLLSLFGGVCIFEETCKPKTAAFRILNPPKSISIKGQTSWTNSYANKERGGGGMMG